MPKVKVEKLVETVMVPQEHVETRIVLDLSIEEALVIKTLTGNISADNLFRDIADKIYNSLPVKNIDNNRYISLGREIGLTIMTMSKCKEEVAKAIEKLVKLNKGIV